MGFLKEEEEEEEGEKGNSGDRRRFKKYGD